MTKYGLEKAELQKIISIVSAYPDIESVVLFGSRAMGNYKKASDVDIAIRTKNSDHFSTAHLKGQFEDETNIPYFFDVIDYNTISNIELKKHINEEGII